VAAAGPEPVLVLEGRAEAPSWQVLAATVRRVATRAEMGRRQAEAEVEAAATVRAATVPAARFACSRSSEAGEYGG